MVQERLGLFDIHLGLETSKLVVFAMSIWLLPDLLLSSAVAISHAEIEMQTSYSSQSCLSSAIVTPFHGV